MSISPNVSPQTIFQTSHEELPEARLESRLRDANIRLLQQATEVLSTISDEAYCRSLDPIARSGIGMHMRHCLDSYEAFLRGLESGRIDYDHRLRGTAIETDRLEALDRLANFIDRFKALDVAAAPEQLLVCLESHGHPEQEWSRSSVRRELQSLVGHTVHHYAIIAMILKLQRIAHPPEFGVASSTLRQH